MRPSQSILRTLVGAHRLIVPCLLVLASATVSEATPRLGRHTHVHAGSSRQSRARHLCNPRTTALRKSFLRRLAVGPVKPPSPRVEIGLSDTFAQLRRVTRINFDDDDAAIQNDAPAAQINGDDTTTPELRPLERLSHSADRLPSTNPFLPRSSRGPPAAA